jgi:hypothetical protein
MSLNLVSPGVKIREVDLTVGGITASNDQVGAIAGPFVKGPINVPILVETEQDLLNTFGKPSDNDGQYEYWMSASSYLSYGGTLRVIRTDSTNLVNANAPVSTPVTNLKITSEEDYNNNYTAPSSWLYASREPGSWANNLKICVIDNGADQTVAIGTFGIEVGYAITCGFQTSYVTQNGTIENFNGYVKGIITKVGQQSIDVKIVSRFDAVTGLHTSVFYEENGLNAIPNISSALNPYVQVFNSVGAATSLEKFRVTNGASVGIGSTIVQIIDPNADIVNNVRIGDLLTTLNGAYVSRVTGVGVTAIQLESAAPVAFAATTVVITYARSALDDTLSKGEGLYFSSDNVVSDWYNNQTLGLTNSTIFWKSIAPKPGTSRFGLERNSKNDEMHVVVVDDSGSITGISGNILEKYTNLSKALDGTVSPTENIYYKNYLSNNSSYIYAGAVDSLIAPQFTTLSGFTPLSGGSIAWGQNANGVVFGCVGSKTYTLSSGYDYSSASGGMAAVLSDILNSYEILNNPAEYNVNFIIAGPSGGQTIFESQAKANKLISIAENRKDCVVTLSPHRAGVVNVTNSDTQTENIINFYNSVTSSSYAVFDSGYKYMFDRFNNKFRYIPLNGDIAGLMARTSINNYPWFSPAGSARGTINNAIKLSYNPTQSQRDLLYPKRVNPVIFSPGAGIILFGDKTALSYSSAFDRINVRRLFLTLEETIERAARAQLFEFNDVITRSNFVNIVEPYLRDVKAKRGITDFLVVCDESNNTPSVIDANQFRADIFIKPARSINFIGLTFVANRTGVSFEEVVGTV